MIQLAPGTTSFSLTHQYLDDQGGRPVPIRISIVDKDAGASSADTTVQVNNVTPVLGDLSAPVIDENGTATVTGSITDPGTLDDFRLEIVWGDGTPTEYRTYPAGTNRFSESHQYIQDSSKLPNGQYPVHFTIFDKDNASSVAATVVTVRKTPRN